VVAAHPDDESLGAGGLIGRAGNAGIPVTVLIASLGEASHPDSSTVSAPELAGIRRREAVAAVATVNPRAEVEFLGLPDGRLTDHETAIIDALRRVVGPRTLLVGHWQHDGHPDHEICGRVVARVAGENGLSFMEFPIWGWHWATPAGATMPLTTWWRIDLDPAELSGKRAALDCYVSQHSRLSPLPGDEQLLRPEFLTHFTHDREIFLGHRPEISLEASYFDRRYRRSADPWGIGERWYEERKRALTLAMLPRRRYPTAFEPGCGTGRLTAELALRCDQLLATDISTHAVEVAHRFLDDVPNVTLRTMAVPVEWPDSTFELIVLSELGYYLGEDDFDELIRQARNTLRPGGTLIACHWRRPVADHHRTGDQVHEKLAGYSGLSRIGHYLDEDMVLEVLVRGEPESVATAEGLTG
jgi:LmbE family N-acetylglucosaminyl deacetylase/SAM-dependent methyltransferase